MFSHPFFRRSFYEVFLRLHQILAGFFFGCVWVHVSTSYVPRLYLYISIGIFASAFSIHIIHFLYRNGLFRRHGFSRACITQINDAIMIKIFVSQPLNVRVGQYINLWIPSVGFWSFLQSHPFVVTSWAEGKLEVLDLIMEPQRGITRDILMRSKIKNDDSILALFSGPHGITAPVEQYDSVIMMASGFGLVAQIPYLKRLTHGYNAGEVSTRRVHLIWQIRSLGG